MFKTPDEYKISEIIISEKEIEDRINELAKDLVKKYKDKKLIIVGILKGAAIVTTNLLIKLHKMGLTDIELSFIRVKSYMHGTTAIQEPEMILDIDINIKNRNLLLIDDICDTGKSLEFVKNIFLKKDPKSVETFVLLDKPERRKVRFIPDYIGFSIPDVWVQGYGMDTDEIGRGELNIIKGPYK